MKKLIIVLGIIFSVHGISLAQTTANPYTVKIDSLQKLTNTRLTNDTIRVKQLNQLARFCFVDMQCKRGFTAAEQARILAEKMNYKKGAGLYYRTMTFFYAENYLDIYFDIKTKWLYRSIHESEEIPGLTGIYYTREIIDKLAEQILKDLPFFEKEKNKRAIAHCSYTLALIYYFWGKPADALPYLDRAIKEFSDINETSLAFALQLYKILVLGKTGEAREAQEMEKDAILTISKMKDEKESALLTYLLGSYYVFVGKSTLMIENDLKLNDRLEENDMKDLKVLVLGDLAVNFGFLSMPQKAVEYYKKTLSLREEINNNDDDAIRLNFNLGFELVNLKDLDEANKYFLKAIKLSEKSKDSMMVHDGRFRFLDATGQILMGRDKYQEALKYFSEANKISKSSGDSAYINLYIAQCQQKLGNLKESINYGEKSYTASFYAGDQRLTLKICNLLYEVYEQSAQPMKAYEYLKKYKNIIKEREEQDIANRSANFEIQSIIEKNQLEKDRLEKDKLKKEKENQNQRWWLVSIAGALLSTFVVLFILMRNNQNKQKANALLQQQKEKVESTLSELKSTQAQLIQSEKMASLGELTAGIAHEIENPLNFVNNFSEVNKEMIVELKDEIDNGNYEEAKLIVNDIEENEEKINHHGRRADAIVKGMLQHSRARTGHKEPADINKLADEYLRLSYHGLRAKDKEFNTDIETAFDESIGKINVVPQDIGRVILNLINNAFYAVKERQKVEGERFKPTVSVQTKKLNDKVEIRVKDNGGGIPKNIVDKIFQPFFTTKPTGQGTGLGLSLAYDIIKAHGGKIKVETKEREGASFTIELPIT